MGDPSAWAVTTTPSMGPSSSEMTSPVSATPRCACTGDEEWDPAYMTSAVTPATAASNRLFRMTPSRARGLWKVLPGGTSDAVDSSHASLYAPDSRLASLLIGRR